jgi:hypothetical protein
MHIFKHYQNVISQEEISDGKKHDEHELVYFAKINDFSILNNLRYEDQEQWSCKFLDNKDARSRVRKTTFSDGTIEYVSTLKVKTTAVVDSETISYNEELSIPTTEEHFNLLKLVAKEGMIKRRFFLPIKTKIGDTEREFLFEIDVFIDDENNYKKWVKIDLEIPKEDRNLLDFKSILPKEFMVILQSPDANDKSIASDQKYFLSNSKREDYDSLIKDDFKNITTYIKFLYEFIFLTTK